MITEQVERHRNGPPRLAGDLVAHLEQVATSRADFPAVVDATGQYSYRALFEQADRVAAYLTARGLTHGELVGLSMRKDFGYVAAIVGCLLNGNPFLPIDPEYPTERKNFMLRDAGAGAAIVDARPSHPITLEDVPLIAVSDLETSQSHAVRAARPLETAYTIYTSGTTGRPKGVPIAPAPLLNHVRVQGRALGVSGESCFATLASISFDMSIWEIFMALGHGARLVALDRETIIDARRLGQAIQEQQVTHILVTPSMLSRFPDGPYAAMECVISAGEKCSAEMIEYWTARSAFYDAYGATEATIYTTIVKKTAKTPVASVGWAMDGTAIAIVDEQGNPLPSGRPGEICILGDTVSAGYHNRPDLNAEKFIRVAGCRAYRTGDAGLLTEEGELYFKGRIDRQIKFNGYRIEVEEIEQVVNDTGLVRSAAVSLYTTERHQSHLILFAVPGQGGFDQQELRRRMRSLLPAHMMPSRILPIPALPLTSSGKVNFDALQDMAKEAYS